MNNAILQLSHEYKVKKVVSCLSTCVFPDKIESYPFDESVLSNGPPHFSNDAYAYSKRMLFHLGNWFMEQDKSLNQKGTLYTSVIPTNLYGAHDNYHLKDGHVLPALMHKCYVSKSKKKCVETF
jgi:GDP-L-fucose synthase